MARLVFGMNQSLDGYVDHMRLRQAPRSSATSSRRLRGRRAVSYGRQMYEVMRYWDDDHPEWDAAERAFAAAVADPAEIGCLALVEVGRPQRQAC